MDGSAASAPAAVAPQVGAAELHGAAAGGLQGTTTDRLSAGAETAACTAPEASEGCAAARLSGADKAEVAAATAAAAAAKALPDAVPGAASPAAASPAGGSPRAVSPRSPLAARKGGGASRADSESGGESPSAARQAAEEALGFSETDRWSLAAQLPRCDLPFQPRQLGFAGRHSSLPHLKACLI